MYKDDIQYTAMRLKGTVVRYPRGECLVYVHDILHSADGGFTARVSGLGRKARDNRFYAELDELDISSPQLGNVDYNGFSLFICRMPKRNDWRQGLREDNLVRVSKGEMHGFGPLPLDVLDAAVYGAFMPYRLCLKKLERDKLKSISFSRNFSLDNERKVWYKNREIVGEDIHGVPTLSPKYTWLKEALEDATQD